MFKDRAFQVKMVKEAVTGETQNAPTYLINLSDIRKEHIQYAVVTTACFVGGRKVLNTICQIAVITAKAKIR